MGQPDQAPRDPRRGPVHAGPEPTRVATTPAPARDPARTPESAPLPPVALPLDLAAIRTRTLAPRDQALDEPRASVEASTRAIYTLESDELLRLQVGALSSRLTRPDLGPALARELARSLLHLRELLLARGDPGDHPRFRDHARWQSLAEPAPAPPLAHRAADPDRPEPRHPARPRPARPPARREPSTQPAIHQPADPAPIPLLEDHATVSRHLLQRSIRILLGRRPPPDELVRVGPRLLRIPEAPLADPAARQILAGFHDAAGTDRDALIHARERQAALREAAARLDDFLGPLTLPADADALELRQEFERAYHSQRDALDGLAAGEAANNAVRVDRATRGLAPPTLASAELVANIDLLSLALDDISKAVTTATRLQAKALGDLATDAANQLDRTGVLARDFPARRFGLLGSVIYLRALLNGTKGLLTSGALLDSSSNPLQIVNTAAKLGEGLVGGLALIYTLVARVRGDVPRAVDMIARYAPIGRAFVWTAATTQLINGLIQLTAVAVTDEKFRRSYLNDVAYGGAGSLPAVAHGAKFLQAQLPRVFARNAATEAEAAATIAGSFTGRTTARLLARAARLAPYAGPLTLYVALADGTLQAFEYAAADFDRVDARAHVHGALMHLEYLGGGISGYAVDLVHILANPALRPLLAASRARSLHDYMRTGLADMQAEHDRRGAPGRVPGLARRLAHARGLVDGADPADPASVLVAARGVLAWMRRLFDTREQRTLHVEELRRADDEARLFKSLHADEKPPPPQP